MARRRFVARRGTPFELLSDQGTNFCGGASELRKAYQNMCDTMKQQLAMQHIHSRFNPPNAPHFGGAWEQEIKTVKAALDLTIGSQTMMEEVLKMWRLRGFLIPSLWAMYLLTLPVSTQ